LRLQCSDLLQAEMLPHLLAGPIVQLQVLQASLLQQELLCGSFLCSS
jgi:hypothetical protein